MNATCAMAGAISRPLGQNIVLGFSQRAALLNPETADATKVAASAVERSVAPALTPPSMQLSPKPALPQSGRLRMKMLFTTKYVVPTTSSAGATRPRGALLARSCPPRWPCQRPPTREGAGAAAQRRAIARLRKLGRAAARYADGQVARSRPGAAEGRRCKAAGKSPAGDRRSGPARGAFDRGLGLRPGPGGRRPIDSAAKCWSPARPSSPAS